MEWGYFLTLSDNFFELKYNELTKNTVVKSKKKS
jgi:hypothetical protein